MIVPEFLHQSAHGEPSGWNEGLETCLETALTWYYKENWKKLSVYI